jgi:methyl-accepting chemotaxis protein
VSFINPSIRDYLAEYLNDPAYLILLASGVPRMDVAVSLFDHFEKVEPPGSNSARRFVDQLVPFARRVNTIPVWAPSPDDPHTLRYHDHGNALRIQSLIRWWRIGWAPEFLEAALEIASQPIGGFSHWADAKALTEILDDLLTASPSEKKRCESLTVAVQSAISGLLANQPDPDDLDRLITAIEDAEPALGDLFASEIDDAIRQTVGNLWYNLDHVDSESTLSDFLDTVEKLSRRVAIAADEVALARSAIENRMEQLAARSAEFDNLDFTGEDLLGSDSFDDEALRDLFAPLLATHQ